VIVEILLPGVPAALYGAAGATLHIALHWKPVDSALWPLTARQRGFTPARRPDYRAIGLLEDAMESSRETELLALAANVAALDTEPDRIEPVRHGSGAGLIDRVYGGRKVSGPHPGPACLCGPCESGRETLEDWGDAGGRMLDERLSMDHKALDALHRAYHLKPTVENANAIRRAQQRYGLLLERRAKL